MTEQILIAGFGGHGLMVLGKILAKAAVKENKQATWFPSYGAEVRGGIAYCFVKISDATISSPFIDQAGTVILFNQPAWNKFKNKADEAGLVIVNSDLVDKNNHNSKCLSFPMNSLALECGSIKMANIIALGVFLAAKPKLLKKTTIEEVLKEAFTAGPRLEGNLKAFNIGLGLINKK